MRNRCSTLILSDANMRFSTACSAGKFFALIAFEGHAPDRLFFATFRFQVAVGASISAITQDNPLVAMD